MATWTVVSDTSATWVSQAGNLLLENGSKLLQEDGTSSLLLEMVDNANSWTGTSDTSATWVSQFGNLLLENGDELLQEDGTSKILLESP